MKTISLILLGMITSLGVHAQTLTDQNMSPINSDSRQLVNYPPEVRAHLLANMREHLQALADIMDAFARAKYTEAADIADQRLGMTSQGATGCQMEGKGIKMMSNAMHLDHQMSQLMPEKMRELGQNMHKAANEFAVKAREADKDGSKAADAAVALAKIPQQCVACHTSFRIQ